MEAATTTLLNSSSGSTLEPEPEPTPSAPVEEPSAFSTDDYFGTGPDGRPVFIGTGGLDGAKAAQLDDLTRIGAGIGGKRPYRTVRRAAVSAGLDLASAEKGHLEVGEIIQVAEIVVYAGRARVRFQPSAEGRPGGWASVRSGGGRELLEPMMEEHRLPDKTSEDLWTTPRERATQLLCGVHGFSDDLSVAMLERPIAGDGATELTEEEWCDALCLMGGAELRDLANLAQRKLEHCAAIDAQLDRGSSALLEGEYATAKDHFCRALTSCESATLERCAVERAQAAANGIAQAEKGLKFAAMSEHDLLLAHAQVVVDDDAGQRLGISVAPERATVACTPEISHNVIAGGPQGRPKAPLPPYAGPSRPTSSMFSIYWRMPKEEPVPNSFEVEYGFRFRGKWIRAAMNTCHRETTADGRMKWSLTIDQLESGQKYVVRVRARNHRGESAWSQKHKGSFHTLNF